MSGLDMTGHTAAALHRNRTALVLYGSETGNAQDAAAELGRTVERLHFLVRVAEMDAINPDDLPTYSIALFVVSTTGQGDLPANTRTFWRLLLRKRLRPNYLQLVRFTTFGLGDSSYPKFNWAARKLHKRLLQLGANEVYPRGEADEQHPDGLVRYPLVIPAPISDISSPCHRIDGSFLPWSMDLGRLLLETYPLPEHVSPIPEDALLKPKWLLAFAEPQEEYSKSTENAATPQEQADTRTLIPTVEESREASVNLPPNDLLPISNSTIATLVQNMRATSPTHWQDVRRLVLSVRSPIEYLPGDVLTIFPKNFPEDVNQFLTLMDWTSIADTPIQFTPSDISIDRQAYPPPPIPYLLSYPKLTLRSLLTHYLDITSIPRRSFFSLITHFTNNAMHKERLLEFTNPKYIDELYDYTTRPRRSILEVLQEFESVRIPWQWVAAVIPVLRGRQFSIASGGALKTPQTRDEGTPGSRVELLVAIVKYRTVIKKIRQGVCTRYIASLPVGTDLAVVVRKGSLDMTKSDLGKPAVMVGPGTGVAPMRALIWERLAARYAMHTRFRAALDYPGTADGEKESVPPSTMGQNVLFFGCRNRDADYFFQDEWEELKQKGHLDVFTAFSRDQKQKAYVQDLVREQSSLIYHLLYKLPGIIYICGSSGKMPQAVREALVEVFQGEGAMPRERAEAYLTTMEKDGRYKQETW